METKKCFKCGRLLPLGDFYRHKFSSDGYLNKCKECTKKDTKQNYANKSKEENWVTKERQRCIEKYERLGYRNRKQTTRDNFNFYNNCAKKLKRLGYDLTGKEAHHWNYNLPNSIFLLSTKAHRQLHLYIKMNKEDKMCYTNDGIRLETSEQAKSVYEHILKKVGINETLHLINI